MSSLHHLFLLGDPQTAVVMMSSLHHSFPPRRSSDSGSDDVIITSFFPPRRSSDSRALPKSARATLPIHSSSTKETISPYSSTSKEMQLLLDDHSAQVKAAQSCYFLPSESYRKFEDESFVYDQNISQSMHDLSSKPSSHKNTLVRIREDISRYSFDKLSPEVPTTSSRWNKFMTLCESEGEEGDEREGSKVNKTTHAQ